MYVYIPLPDDPTPWLIRAYLVAALVAWPLLARWFGRTQVRGRLDDNDKFASLFFGFFLALVWPGFLLVAAGARPASWVGGLIGRIVFRGM